MCVFVEAAAGGSGDLGAGRCLYVCICVCVCVRVYECVCVTLLLYKGRTLRFKFPDVILQRAAPPRRLARPRERVPPLCESLWARALCACIVVNKVNAMQ